MSDKHYSIEFDRNEEGWWVGRCHCGWDGGLYPDAEDAADALMDHAYERGRAARGGVSPSGKERGE